MAARKIQVTLPDGKTIDVPVPDTNGEWSDVRLEDGTRVRVKKVVSSSVRVDATRSGVRIDGQDYTGANPISTQSPVAAIVRQIFSFLCLLLWRPKADESLSDPSLKS